MRKFLTREVATAFFISLASLNTFAQSNSNTEGKKPNIIYIMADDLGYADLSGYGRKDYQTPNLDKLASEGIKFVNAYAAAPVCTPTRTAFITGQYPARHQVGLREPWIPDRDSLVGLSKDAPSIATQLHNAGYETALIGKWHIGNLKEFSPNEKGFDYFYGIKTGYADYVSHKGDGNRPDLFENDQPIVENGYLTTMLKDHALKFIRQKHSKPFFLSLDFNAPHWPWQGPGDAAYPDTMDTRAGGSPATYARMMIALDEAIGAVIKAIDEQSLSKNTLIIFTSDNGGERFSDMGIYKGKKLSLWEGGIKVPAFVCWKGMIKPNLVSDQVCVTMDWTATILAVAGAKINPQHPLDGVNLLPVCTGQSALIDRTIYWRTIERSHHKAIRDGNWKYLKDEKGEYLFDLSVDPSEKNNLSEKNSEKFQQLKTKYAAWEAGVLGTFVRS